MTRQDDEGAVFEEREHALRRTGISRMTIRSLLIKATVIVGSVFIALLIGEFVTREFNLGTVRLNEMQGSVLKYKPHVRFLNRKENNNWVETNSFGFHDAEREKTSGKYRILFLGDSYVEGLQVPTDKLFTSVLEKRFLQNGREAECINAGVSGTGTAYQYTLWKEVFDNKVAVDHLVLAFYLGNDIENNNIDLSFPPGNESFFVDADGKVFKYAVKESVVRSLVGHIRDHSALANTVYEMLHLAQRSERSRERAKDERVKVDYRIAKENGAGAWQVATKGTLALIKNWNLELAGKSITMDVMVIDRPSGIYNDFESDFLEQLRAMCAQQHIGFLRLGLTTNPYEVYSFDGKVLGHFNYKGHELAAAELYDYFKSTYGDRLLPEYKRSVRR